MQRILYRTKDEQITKVQDGQTIQPYAEYLYIIPAGARQEINVCFNWFKILTQSGGAITVKIGDNGVETTFSDITITMVGKEVFDRLTIINSGGTQMTIRIAMGYGY